MHPTYLWPFSKSKFNLKSDRVNFVAPASPFECPLYLRNIRAVQYKPGPERLTRHGNSNVLRLPWSNPAWSPLQTYAFCLRYNSIIFSCASNPSQSASNSYQSYSVYLQLLPILLSLPPILPNPSLSDPNPTIYLPPILLSQYLQPYLIFLILPPKLTNFSQSASKPSHFSQSASDLFQYYSVYLESYSVCLRPFPILQSMPPILLLNISNPSQFFSVRLNSYFVCIQSYPMVNSYGSWLKIIKSIFFNLFIILNLVCEVFDYDHVTRKCCIEDITYTTTTNAPIWRVIYRPVTTVTAKRAPTVSTFI